MKDLRREEEPHDRMTRLCDTMIKSLGESPEASGNEKCIIFLEDEKRSGIVLHGYETDIEAMADLFVHLTAIFHANGKQLLLVPLGEG